MTNNARTTARRLYRTGGEQRISGMQRRKGGRGRALFKVGVGNVSVNHEADMADGCEGLLGWGRHAEIRHWRRGWRELEGEGLA